MTTVAIGDVRNVRFRAEGNMLSRWLELQAITAFGTSELVTFRVPEDPKQRIRILEQLRADVGDALERAQGELVAANLQSLTPEPPAQLATSGKQTAKLARCRCSTPHLKPAECPEYEAEREGIARDLERENAFFTKTQGWDPRGDGP